MIDLSQYVGKQITALLRDGSHVTGVVSKSTSECYPFIFNEETYIASGAYRKSSPDDLDIIAIEEIKPAVAENGAPTLSELEVRKTQLEAELEEVERQIRVANGPEGFSASEVFNFLHTEGRESVSLMFQWNSTPQGYEHWQAIRAGDKKLSREDVEYLMNCLSKHFLRKFE